jgi:hypothetical protein
MRMFSWKISLRRQSIFMKNECHRYPTFAASLFLRLSGSPESDFCSLG